LETHEPSQGHVKGQEAIGRGTATLPYQVALRTSLPSKDVLDQVDVTRVPGMVVAERGAHYLVLKAKRRFRYGADLAAGLAIAIVLALLILTAVTPVVLVGLPLALLPALPLLLEHRPDLAVSAIEDEGTTRVTAHGEATPDLAEYLDRYLESLPAENGYEPDEAETEEPGSEPYSDEYGDVTEGPEADTGWYG